MVKRLILYFLLSTISLATVAQSEWHATLAAGNAEGTISFSYQKDWGLFKNKKLGVGLGLRFTSYAGVNQEYTTAPAELTSEKTGLLVIFTPDVPDNIDTVLIESPQVNASNVMINLRYLITERFTIGFNIDAIGFSFGKVKSSRYVNGDEMDMIQSKPSSFNLLLTSDNDKGSLNSEFYAKYRWNENWGLKIAAQFLFTEYTTETAVQQYPEPNDRFRNKSLLVAVGVTYQFK